MSNPIKTARLTPLPSGHFRLEIITALPHDQSQLLNLPDSVQEFDNLTFAQLVQQLRFTFPEIAATP